MSCDYKRLQKKCELKWMVGFSSDSGGGEANEALFFAGLHCRHHAHYAIGIGERRGFGFSPAPSAPYVPRTFNWSRGPSWGGGGGCCCCVPPPPPPCCCCGGWSSSGWSSVQWSSGGWTSGGWGGGGWGGGGWGGG